MKDHEHLAEKFFDRKKQKAEKKLTSKKDRSQYKKTDLVKKKRLLEEKQVAVRKRADLSRGRVLSVSGSDIYVDCNGVLITCSLRGVLKKEVTTTKNLVATGDFVLFDSEGSIIQVETRTSLLSRKEHGREKQQILAVNIDQVLITVSAASPPLNPPIVDRFIIATTKGEMRPLIVINKFDLATPQEQGALLEFLATYQALGIDVIVLSAKTGEGLELLKKQMEGKASVFAGESGVGKSSLINAVTGLNLFTQEVTKKNLKGVHSTVGAKLIPLAFGGWCIDTPGIQSFGLWDLQKEDLYDFFQEIHEKRCKFADCSHSHEPGCAVRKALDEGTLSAMRYNSYRKLLEELNKN